jgi:hypothetical protein
VRGNRERRGGGGGGGGGRGRSDLFTRTGTEREDRISEKGGSVWSRIGHDTTGRTARKKKWTTGRVEGWSLFCRAFAFACKLEFSQ